MERLIAFFDKSRHSKGGKGCRAACPIWVQGSLRGEYIRRALNLRSWEAASELVRAWDASGTIGVVKPDVPTVSEAVRVCAPALSASLQTKTPQRLLPWCDKHGVRLLKSLDVDAIRRFRATWLDAPITAARNLERLRNFFWLLSGCAVD